MEINGKEWVNDTPLSERWPLYTRGNVGEVFPDAVTPLVWSICGQANEDSWREAWWKFGLVAKGDFDQDRVIVCTVGGYAYLNMSYIRLLGVRTPGTTVKEVDKSLLGEADAPKYIPRRRDNSFYSSLRLLWRNQVILRTRRVRLVEKMQKISADWVAKYPGDDASDEALLTYIEDFKKPYHFLFGNHVFVTFCATNAAGNVALLCAMKVKDPGLTLDLLSGVEGVESAEPARFLWTLGRLVNASPALTKVFEAGVDADTWPALQQMPEAEEFVRVFNEFIARYGYRGSNEWEFAAPSWRMRPHVPLRAVDRMRLSSEENAPGADYAEQAKNAAIAKRYAKRKLWPMDRLKFRHALPSAKAWQIAREASKSSVIRAMDQTRRAMNLVFERVAQQQGVADPQDFFMLTWPEFLEQARGEADHLALIEDRKIDYAKIKERVPPFMFEGTPPPLDEWKLREGTVETAGQKGDILEGIGGSPGRVVGRARIVLDTENPDVLEPGDILVAPITDPSWTPLFLAAEGVVVDVGAVMSHSVIVSRDLGIPCVVSVTDATRIIPDGALIEIDGDIGSVTILDPDGPAVSAA
ncbi:MAG: PEP-utilizing enzyme [Maritimibacter sp.]